MLSTTRKVVTKTHALDDNKKGERGISELPEKVKEQKEELK